MPRHWLDELDVFSFLLQRLVQIAFKLQVRPKSRRVAEEFSQSQRRTGCNPPTAIDNLINPLVGDADTVS